MTEKTKNTTKTALAFAVDEAAITQSNKDLFAAILVTSLGVNLVTLITAVVFAAV